MSKNLFELYGFSEGFATMLKPHNQRKKISSVGTPVLGFEIKIIDEKENLIASKLVFFNFLRSQLNSLWAVKYSLESVVFDIVLPSVFKLKEIDES